MPRRFCYGLKIHVANIILDEYNYYYDKFLSKGESPMRAIVTVIGKDKVGIIASLSNILANCNVNILDISQTTMQDIFTMIMLVDISGLNIPFSELSEQLEKKGVELGLSVRIQHEDIFNSMHQI